MNKKNLSINRSFSMLAALMVYSACVYAQTSSPYGFEDGAGGTIATWVGYSGTESVSLNTNATYSRTGANSIKLTTTSSSSNKQWYGTSPYDSSYNNETIFFVYWAKADFSGASMDGSFRYASSLPVSSTSSSNSSTGTVPLSTTTWSRVTNSISSSSTRYYFSGPRKTTGGAGNVYLDDGILYTSTASNPTVDTNKPFAPSALSAVASGNLVSLNWTSNTDDAAGTGVQATIVLRNSNTSASAPVMNDQGVYSATGGAAGPNTVPGGWQVVSTTLGATANSYLDIVSTPGNYVYAVVLRDLVYNYSVAAMSSAVTTGAASPTIFVNGSAGNFGPVISGTISAVNQYSVVGYNLTGSMTATAPAGFQVSLSATSGFGSSVSIAPTGGIISSTPIYTRYLPTSPNGSTGTLNITNTSAGSNVANEPVTGTAIATQPTTVGSISFGVVTGSTIAVNLPTVGNGTNRIIVVSAGTSTTFVPTDGVTVAGVNANIATATDQGGGNFVIYDGSGSGNNVVTVTGLSQSTHYYFTVYEYNIGTNNSQNYLVTPGVTGDISTISITPTISVDQTGFTGVFNSTAMGSTSAPQQFNVSGIYLTNNVTITPPAGFQISTTSGSGYSTNPITLTESAGVIPTTAIYVVFAPTTATGATGTQSITFSSTGVVNLPTVAVSGNALAVEPTAVGTITFGTVTLTTIPVNLPTVGNGSHRIIVANLGSAPGFVPTDGVAATGVNADYTLAASQPGGGRIVYDGTGSGNNVVTVTNLDSGTLYYFAVYEYNVGSGTSQNYFAGYEGSDITTALTYPPNAGVKNVAASDVKLYPNPATDQLFISAPVRVHYMINDMQGRVMGSGIYSDRIGLDQLAAGMYIITITDETGAVLKVDKLVKTL